MIYRGYEYSIIDDCVLISTLSGDIIMIVDTESEAINFIDDYIARTNNE